MKSTARPVGYLQIEPVLWTRLRLVGAYLVSAIGALAYLAGYEAVRLLLALMVVHSFVR